MKTFNQLTPLKGKVRATIAVTMLSLIVLVAMGYQLAKEDEINLIPIGTYVTGVFDQAASKSVKHDPSTQRLFVVNAYQKSVDAIDISDPHNPSLQFRIDISPYGYRPNSVDVNNGLVAIAVEADPKTDPGKILIFDINGKLQNTYDAGSLPDAVVFTSDGEYVLSANEGEPNDAYTIDPEGSITIVHLPTNSVSQVTFDRFNSSKDALRASGIRVFGPRATVAQDLEPEEITISSDGSKAFVTLQENNAFAEIDILNRSVVALRSFGVKQYTSSFNKLDASNHDNGIKISNHVLNGLYQPDGIDYYRINGQEFIITANEGDARVYEGFNEECRVKDLKLHEKISPRSGVLQKKWYLGQLKVSSVMGAHEGKHHSLFSFGARSFSIWTTQGEQVFDSGDQFERITAKKLPYYFNSDNNNNLSFDSRSDDKGPEPEGIVIGKVDDKTLAFIGLERIGGIMVYDVTNPYEPQFLNYVNNRNFSAVAMTPQARDLGPEGLHFISKDQSPIPNSLLVVSNEVSGTTTIYKIESSTIDSDLPL